MSIIDNKKLDIGSGKVIMISFLLVTACFALWGFANNVTTTMVSTFSRIFRINPMEAALVPVVAYLGYFCMAFPAALYIRRHSFKSGTILGLMLFAVGTLLFIPAKFVGNFYPFLIAYFIMTCGLSFLETSCTPYVYCMGREETGIFRLNFAQSFNALGAMIAMMVTLSIHSNISTMGTAERLRLPLQQFNIIKDHDLGILIQPYIYIGAIVVLLLVVIWMYKLSTIEIQENDKGLLDTLKDLWQKRNYREGVIAEFFYVGAQTACWTYIIPYGTHIFIGEGLTESAAEVMAQKYNVIALVFFASSRFICTGLLRWFSPERMLSTMAILGISALIGVIFFTDRNGLYCLVAVSICMSLMFPTIYGLALRGIHSDIKIAGAGLIMSILGGSFFPPIQSAIILSDITLLGVPCSNLSFIIPMLCLAVVVWYGHRAYVRHAIQGGAE